MEVNLWIPVLYPMLAGLVVYGVGRKNKNLRDYAADFVVVSEFVFLFATQFIPFLAAGGNRISYEQAYPYAAGLGMSLTMDGFRALYTTLAAFMWVVSTCFSREYFRHYRNRNRYYLFLLWTLGATMGVFLSADLFTTFVFFEIASFTSYVWVVQDERKESMRAGETYLAIAVIGGLVMLMGLALLYHETGTLRITDLQSACAAHLHEKTMVAAGACLFFGFAAKAGAVPLHIWLPKAHPVAPAPASALLSGMLTKIGVFGVLIVSSQIFHQDGKWGTFVLAIGVLTMLTGAVLALLSVDLKRTLACSSVSQIGFILAGVGMQGLLGEENALAVRGTVLYMVNHSLFKLVLFLSAGVVFMNLHKLDLNSVRGFGRKKPLLSGVFLCGALGIAGVPLFSGYVSKTLLHESIVEYMELLNEGKIAGVLFGISAMRLVEWLFLISGGMTLAYMLKLYVAIFIEKNADETLQREYDEKKDYLSLISKILLSCSAALFLLFGLFPNRIFGRLADMGQAFLGPVHSAETLQYFGWECLKGSLISLGIGVLLYIFVVRGLLMKKETIGNQQTRVYVNRWHDAWDLENVVYRPLFAFLDVVCSTILRVCDKLLDYVTLLLRRSFYKDSKLPHELEEGTAVTHALGMVLDDGKLVVNKFFRKKKPITVSFEHKLAMINEELEENNTIIGRSLSFGLFMFCLGLLLTLGYMLWG